MKRLGIVAALCLSFLTGFFMAQPRRHVQSQEPSTSTGIITISFPDTNYAANRRTIRLTELSRPTIPIGSNDYLALPPTCWVISVNGQSYYGTSN